MHILCDLLKTLDDFFALAGRSGKSYEEDGVQRK
jgi:hypothetical protein